MKAGLRKTALAFAAFSIAGVCAVAGCAPQMSDGNTGAHELGAAAGATTRTATLADWKALYPAEYYSFADGADDMGDVGGMPIDENNAESHATLYDNMKTLYSDTGGFPRATCISCKSATFNDWYEEYGWDVFYDRYNADVDNRWADALEKEDVLSCRTCHADIDDPAGSVGSQIMTFELFGGDLLDELDPETAACGQCHNGLAPWNHLEILDGVDLATTEVSAYRYGTDPASLIKATLEDATATSEAPNGKLYDPSLGIYTKTSEELDIYRIDTGAHFEVELFQGSVMQQAGLTCVDCHMPTLTNTAGEAYTSHDASGSPLDSYAALTTCLSCHKNQGIETQDDMVAFVREVQAEVAARDEEVTAKQDKLYDVLSDAIVNEKFDEATLDEARYNYAVAAYYREYAFGVPEKAGEKVAHNPEATRQYYDTASSLLDDTLAMLA